MHQAVASHEAGRFTNARALYQQVLEQAPDYADALHLLGLLHCQTGEIAKGIPLLRKAIARRPDQAQYHINLAKALVQEGKHPAARKSLEKAVEIDHDAPEAHQLLGDLAALRGDLEAASGHYRKALALRPAWSQVLNNLGLTLVRLGGHDDEAMDTLKKAVEAAPREALLHMNLGLLAAKLNPVEGERHLREACRLQPDNAEARNNLGISLRKQERLEEAELAFGAAVENDPGHFPALQNLALSRYRANDLESAIRLTEAAVAAAPDRDKAYGLLGSLYHEAGEFDKAVNLIRSTVRLTAENAELISQLAQSKKFTDADAGLLNELERIVRLPDTGAEERIVLHFALGKACDDMRRYDDAFGHFQQANELDRNKGVFDRDAHRAYIDRLIDTFDEAFFSTRRGIGSDSNRPIFVVGMPRSGTTMTEQILASHPQVFGAGELTTMSALVRRIPEEFCPGSDYPEAAGALDRESIAVLAEAYLHEIASLNDSAVRVVDKMPHNFLLLGVIAVLFPNAHIIHCMRNPADTCLSCYTKRFNSRHPYNYDLADLGFYYREYRRLMAHWRRVLPISLFDLRYEETVSEPEPVIRALIENCELPWDDACLAFHKTRRGVKTPSAWQVRQPLYQSSRERWRNYAAHLEPLLQALGEQA